MGFLDKAKALLSKNADKVDTVIDKAGEMVDKRTHGKYASHVDKVQEAARKAVANNAGDVPPGGDSGQVPPTQPPPSTPPPSSPPSNNPPPTTPPQQPPTAPPTS
ncbi:antitoxin [Mycobacterium sp. ITM-2016-00317]|uniref:antitoxin n=1 Tax=Mycobacterium sp. ITM-2016-00317 TaxID=2099694 RepID=UPI000D4053A4|nr:antitoxin [Mycobacterium sp. ITM-2016-00317]WNG86676.1 antitoxin [Mycobacterium sp. ITM-2016-00317]